MSDHQLVRFKVGKTHFEVVVKPNTVLQYREGKLGIDKVLIAEEVFKDFRKGDRARTADLESAFNMTDVMKCIETILEKGEYQLSAAERREKVEKRRKEIVNYIHKYYTDPRTKTPHPVTRIENALDEMRLRIDPDAPGDGQAQSLISKLVDLIPLKRSEIEGTMFIPHKYVGSLQPSVRKYCEVRKEKYDGDGCWMDIGVVPGDYDALMADISHVGKGEVTFEVDGVEAMASSEEPQMKKAHGGKGGKGKGAKRGKARRKQ
jgi:ribosome maturation protein SDO1